ncbi:hypothetical protein AMECASPLE_019017 [Ameca splendens]|uniref:Uncharacterized protein n=1 Tax=Ameca splendens TaxID=208324 RepID=A0ABV0Z170_9TELE
MMKFEEETLTVKNGKLSANLRSCGWKTARSVRQPTARYRNHGDAGPLSFLQTRLRRDSVSAGNSGSQFASAGLREKVKQCLYLNLPFMNEYRILSTVNSSVFNLCI